MDRKIGGMTIRELTGFLLLITLLLAGLLLSWHTGRQHEKIAAGLESSAWLALSGQWENARQQAESVRQQWERDQKLWSALGNQTPMDEISSLFAELKIYGAAGERTEFARICAVLSQKMEAMGNAHRLSWWNVL